MLTVSAKRHLRRVDRFDCRDGIALDARYLDKASHRITCQPQIVLKANLCSIFNLLRGCPQYLGKACCGHCTGRADFALAADLCTRNRRVACMLRVFPPSGA